MKLISKNTV